MHVLVFPCDGEIAIRDGGIGHRHREVDTRDKETENRKREFQRILQSVPFTVTGVAQRTQFCWQPDREIVLVAEDSCAV